MSKNNPENRGEVTELRKFNGKKVKPVKFIDSANRRKYIAAMYEDGKLAINPATKQPIAYASCEA